MSDILIYGLSYYYFNGRIYKTFVIIVIIIIVFFLCLYVCICMFSLYKTLLMYIYIVYIFFSLLTAHLYDERSAKTTEECDSKRIHKIYQKFCWWCKYKNCNIYLRCQLLSSSDMNSNMSNCMMNIRYNV